uniref:Ribosomal protein S8 n=1 Tax=Triparma laevis TaxID=1534972 RepID=A0A0K2RWJ0_9STRA|nr:ribosomal protein S8 [Triparma laevis]BAS19174.1 ribosomal protein S8 [Triparma laevis]
MNHFLWNLYTRLRNGQIAKKIQISQPRNKLCEKVLNLLWREGYILNYGVSENNPSMFEVFLKYHEDVPAIKQIKVVSKPSRRIYLKSRDLWKINDELQLIIVSTTRGILTGKECKKFNLGGEVFCIIK